MLEKSRTHPTEKWANEKAQNSHDGSGRQVFQRHPQLCKTDLLRYFQKALRRTGLNDYHHSDGDATHESPTLQVLQQPQLSPLVVHQDYLECYSDRLILQNRVLVVRSGTPAQPSHDPTSSMILDEHTHSSSSLRAQFQPPYRHTAPTATPILASTPPTLQPALRPSTHPAQSTTYAPTEP